MKKVPIKPTGATIGSSAWIAYMDELIRYWTGWDSLEHMCANCPTLMISKHNSPENNNAIMEMREAYKFVNGREAWPEDPKGGLTW